MDSPMSNLHFRLLFFGYKIRDLLESRESILAEVNIAPGYHVLDFGCGPGSYILPLTTMVGESGKIYALDIHPLAVESVNKMIKEKSLTNVKTILSGLDTHLPDECIDVILLYDIYHSFRNPDAILHELHRVLTPEGILSFSDHHLQENEIITSLTGKEIFTLLKKGKKTYTFKKV